MVKYLKDVISDFGANIISSVITDNASTMQSAWRKLVDAREMGDTWHILFMSCSCHMLHNYVGLVLKSSYYEPAFTLVKSILKQLRKLPFRKYYIRHVRALSCPHIPFYTKIRWGSAEVVVNFVAKHIDILIEYFQTSNAKEFKVIRTNLLNLKDTVYRLDKLLKRIILSIRHLEGQERWICDSYYELGKLRYYMQIHHADQPDLLVKYDKMWNRSYSDITLLGVLLSPYYFNVLLNKNNTENRYLSSNINVNSNDFKNAVTWIKQLAFPAGVSDSQWADIWKRYQSQIKSLKFGRIRRHKIVLDTKPLLNGTTHDAESYLESIKSC